MDLEKFAEVWNTFQYRYIVWWAYGLGLIEIIDVILRFKTDQIKLVSHVMRQIAFSGMTAFAFFFGSMTVHWFVTWHRATWEGTTAHLFGALFWAVFAAYLFASWFDPSPQYWPVGVQWLRYPPVAALIGGVLAYVCFPQHSLWFPGRM